MDDLDVAYSPPADTLAATTLEVGVLSSAQTRAFLLVGLPAKVLVRRSADARPQSPPTEAGRSGALLLFVGPPTPTAASV